MSIHKDFPRPWHITHTARHRAHGYYSHIRAANDNYVVERITDEDLALYIVQVVNERDQLRADLAAANARAEAAEAKLAAVPVREIGRWYNNSSTHNAIEAGRYGYYDALGDSQVIKDWLGSQSEAQP
ncbi:MAG: hypothetical protein KAX65_13810 [Caldilineaceae bacterium]|nr:hypothetical protein [Caldilineaceae bacterium]